MTKEQIKDKIGDTLVELLEATKGSDIYQDKIEELHALDKQYNNYSFHNILKGALNTPPIKTRILDKHEKLKPHTTYTRDDNGNNTEITLK